MRTALLQQLAGTPTLARHFERLVSSELLGAASSPFQDLETGVDSVADVLSEVPNGKIERIITISVAFVPFSEERTLDEKKARALEEAAWGSSTRRGSPLKTHVAQLSDAIARGGEPRPRVLVAGRFPLVGSSSDLLQRLVDALDARRKGPDGRIRFFGSVVLVAQPREL